VDRWRSRTRPATSGKAKEDGHEKEDGFGFVGGGGVVGGGRVARAQYSDIRITEVMSSSGSGGTVDWFEITNYGLTLVTLVGWTMDDSSYSFGSSVALSGVTSIAPGESVIFLESAGGADVESFRTFWGGIDTLQIGYYSGSGVGLSSSGDGIVLFDSAGTEETPRVQFGAAPVGASFNSASAPAGDPTTSPNAAAVVSTAGSWYGQITYTSADALGNVGSLGTAAVLAIPEPATGALLGLGALGLCGYRRRRNRD
jgi:hypothetical protein